MGIITITIGDQEILAGMEANNFVTSIADYVPVYVQIATALHNEETFDVAVSHPTVAAWFERMQERYGSTKIVIKHETLRGRLAEQLQLDIPDWVTDDHIRQANLLEIRISAAPNQNFEDFMLEIHFSPFMARPRLPLSELDDLVSSYDRKQWNENRRHTVLNLVLEQRLSAWEEAASKEIEKTLIDWLRRDPEFLGKQLALLKVSEGYSDRLGQRILGATFVPLRELELDLSRIEVNESVVTDALDTIQVYLQELKVALQAGEALEVILSQASGHLEIEFDAVLSLLTSGELTLDGEIVSQVRKLFAPIRDRPRIDQALADLDLLIKPEDPPRPQEEWSEDQWLDWAVTRYLPYRFWLEEIGQLGEEVAELAETYAEWLFSYYQSARLNSKRLIYQALPERRSLMQDDSAVLILIIDNFNQKFQRDFQRHMRRAGFFSQETSHYLSMLPSATEISKKCLISGQPEPFSGTAYEKPVKEIWEAALSGKRVCYLPHIGALRSIKKREHDIYFLNYMPLDMALHQDEKHSGISHAQAIRSYLGALAEDVRAFGERIGAERDLVVLSLSDHGSTRIPSEEPNPIDAKFFRNRVEDEHHRYASIKDNELADLPENVRYQCYIFERGKYDLDTNYLAARRYYRFRPTSDSIYVHGGLTPEETIIPVTVFRPIQVTAKPMQIDLVEDTFYYGRRSQIRFELVNTNAYACEDVRLEILNAAADVPMLDVGDISPMSRREVMVEGQFRRGRDDLNSLDIRINYDFLGEPQQQTGKVEVTMRKMMEQAFDLGDLLD